MSPFRGGSQVESRVDRGSPSILVWSIMAQTRKNDDVRRVSARLPQGGEGAGRAPGGRLARGRGCARGEMSGKGPRWVGLHGLGGLLLSPLQTLLRLG